MWAPDSSLVTIAFNAADGSNKARFDHLGLVGLDGHVTRVDVPGGIDVVPRDIRGFPAAETVAWAPDGSRFVVYGTIVSRDGRLIRTVSDAVMAAWSWNSQHLAVGGPASSRIRVVDADGSNPQEIGAPVATQVDQLVWVP
jgi:hypothetical protein